MVEAVARAAADQNGRCRPRLSLGDLNDATNYGRMRIMVRVI